MKVKSLSDTLWKRRPFGCARFATSSTQNYGPLLITKSGDLMSLAQIFGFANEWKEGDGIIGLGTSNESTRQNAREYLEQVTIKFIQENPIAPDELQELIFNSIDRKIYDSVKHMTISEMKTFLLEKSEEEIKSITPGLNSDVIACVVRLMTIEELRIVGGKIFNNIQGTNIGAKGYLSARIQPNSPTDNVSDIKWQIFNAFSFAIGDLMIGTNPVDSEKDNIAAIAQMERDVVDTFNISDVLAWCVLGHIDISDAISNDPQYEKLIGLSFQSLAGTVRANGTYGVTIANMERYVKSGLQHSEDGFYFETGQGSEFTNGTGTDHVHVDMVTLEARKHGFIRYLNNFNSPNHWTVVNDVAGFIGPEVFKTREQLSRAVHEDIVMGKLHSLTIGSDVCATLHMDLSFEDLDWCLDSIIPVCPSHLMALSTKNDPMLGYMSTSFQDHVRLTRKFGLKINDKMRDFFIRLQIIDENGNYTKHAGDPLWVHYQYCKLKGDERSEKEIRESGEEELNEVLARGVHISRGHGKEVWDLNDSLKKELNELYHQSKESLKSELSEKFLSKYENKAVLTTRAKSKDEHISFPKLGESLSDESIRQLEAIEVEWKSSFYSRLFLNEFPEVQIVITDGLNSNAITDDNHLQPFLDALIKQLTASNMKVSPTLLFVLNGRVRTGYQIGHILFRNSSNSRKTIINIVGERPGTTHNCFSAYVASPPTSVWRNNSMDHNLAKLVSGVSDTSLDCVEASKKVVQFIHELNQEYSIEDEMINTEIEKITIINNQINNVTQEIAHEIIQRE